MKKSLVALAVLAASGAAMAQSSVTISGNVAVAYEQTDTANAQVTGYDFGTNRIIFAGTEDLGGGLKAGFHIQNRFDLTNGTNQNTSALALEETFISLSGGFGTIKAGRFQAFSNARFDAFLGYGPRVYQTYGYNSHTHNRLDKQVSYDSPNISGFTVGVATTSNVANTNGEYTVVRAMYAQGPLDVQVSWEKNNNAAAAATATAGATPAKRVDYAIGASYDFKVAKVMFLHGKEEGTSADTSFGVNVPFGAVLLKAQYRTEREGTNKSGKTTAIGVDYALSKRTVAFADASNVDGAAQQAYRIGVRHSF